MKFGMAWPEKEDIEGMSGIGVLDSRISQYVLSSCFFFLVPLVHFIPSPFCTYDMSENFCFLLVKGATVIGLTSCRL